MFRPTYYCGSCATEANEGQEHCVQCGARLELRTHGRRMAAVVLNELANLLRDGMIGGPEYLQARARYYPRLQFAAERAAVAGAHAPATGTPTVKQRPVAEPVRPAPSLPSWLLQQAPNILLYLGAFLTIIAALVFVSATGGELSGDAKLAMLVAYTAAFGVVGWLCYGVPRIRVAGYTFVALSALLVPLNLAAAYNFALEKEGVPANVVWLAASLYCSLFYTLLGALGLGRLYGLLANAAVVSAVASATVVAEVPAEWTPPFFAALAICLLLVAWYAPARVREAFRLPTLIASHLLPIASVVAASAVLALPASVMGRDVDEAALTVTLALAGAFFTVAGAYYRDRAAASVYGYAACGAFAGSLVSGLVVAQFPTEWIPAVLIGFASALLAGSRPERFRSALGGPAAVSAQVIAGAAACFAPLLAVSVSDADRLALPVALVLALGFFLPLALTERDRRMALLYEIFVLTLAGGCALSVPFVLEKEADYYSMAFAAIAGVCAIAALVPVDRQRFTPEVLWAFALSAATAAWLAFLGIFEQKPSFGAGAAWTAGAVYLGAAFAPNGRQALRSLWSLLIDDRAGEGFPFRSLLVLAFAALLGLGYAYFLHAIAPNLAPDEAALLFLPFPLAFAAAGTVVGRWSGVRPDVLYVAAAGYSLFVTAASYGDWGQMAVVLGVFAVAAAGVAIAEREPWMSHASIAYAVWGLVFLLVHWQPDDQVWPMPFVILSLVLYVIALAVARWSPDWSQRLVYGSFAVALLAPAVGFGLLTYRVAEVAAEGTPIGFADPPLYLWSTATVAIVGVLAAVEAVRSRAVALAYGSSAVFMVALLLVIAYFSPDNPQAYTVPIAVYLLGLVFAAGGRRKELSEDVRILLSCAEVLVGVILLGTTLLQSIGEEHLTYHFLLLGESIGYLIVGLLLRRRLVAAPGLAFATVAAALLAIEGSGGGGILPPWAILALAGGALLALGFLFLVRLDIWQRLQRSAIGWWRDWEEADVSNNYR